MINRLKNKWVFIRGATPGIGKASAELLAQQSCNLVLTGRRGE